jgi:hypothetical protein
MQYNVFSEEIKVNKGTPVPCGQGKGGTRQCRRSQPILNNEDGKQSQS